MKDDYFIHQVTNERIAVKSKHFMREVIKEEQSELDRLKAENARFREVLEYIANPKKIHDASIFSTKVYWDLAREALNSKNNT